MATNDKSKNKKQASTPGDTPFRKGQGSDESYGIPQDRADVDAAFEQFQAFTDPNSDQNLMGNLWAGAENKMDIGDNFGGINTDFKNQSRGLTNTFGGLENQFGTNINQFANMENTFEDLTVDLEGRNFQQDSLRENQANVLNQLRDVGGSSGGANLAQSLIKSGSDANRQIGADTSRQMQQNQLATANQAGKLQQMEAQGQQSPQIYDVEIKRSRKRNQVKIETMPPEEFFVDAAATSLDDAMVVGHRTMSTVSSLVALGYDQDILDDHLSDEFAFVDSDEYTARYSNTEMPGPVSAAERRRVLYTEAWCYIDYDGDGIAELRRICTVGNNYEIVNNEPADSIPFAMFACDPEPHVFFGSDIADLTKDIQRVKSAVLRGMLDSLSFALYPRTGVVEGMVNIDDVLNPEVGSVIRMRQPGMVQQLDVPFLGKDAFPMIQYLDSMKESRTGQTAASQGLDPDVLQSTTRVAVTATIKGAEQHLELMARLFADSFKRMFKGILRLIITHQDRERIVRLRDEWVPIDPRVWDSAMDCSVSVGLGVGTTDERLAVLNQTAMRQQEALEKLGPNNPLVGLGQVRNTLSKMLEISGYPDSNQFFKPIPLDYEPPPPQPPKPSPEELLAQAQMADIEARTAIDQQKIQLDAMKQQQLDERESARIAGDLAIREFQAESKFENDVDLELIKASLKEGL